MNKAEAISTISQIAVDAIIKAPVNREEREAFLAEKLAEVVKTAASAVPPAEYRTPDPIIDFLFKGTPFADLPSGFDGAEVKESSKKTNLEFYGLKLHRFHKPGGWTKLIGKRTFENGEPHRIYEVFVENDGAKSPREGLVYENGNLLFTIVGHHLNQNMLEGAAISALHNVIKRRRRNNTHRKEEENA